MLLGSKVLSFGDIALGRCNLFCRTYARQIGKGRLQHRKQREPSLFDNLTEFEKQNLLTTAEETENLQEKLKSTVKAKMTLEERLRAEQRAKEWLKMKIIERKHFKKEQEINLLTYDAKEQIRYLNGEYPEEWTPERISKSFPISVEGVRKLLKSKCRVTTLEQVQNHDKNVIKHWEQLDKAMASKITSRYLPSSKGNSPSKEVIHRLASVNPNLPGPARLSEKYKVEQRDDFDIPKGKFESVVTRHLKLGKMKSNK